LIDGQQPVTFASAWYGVCVEPWQAQVSAKPQWRWIVQKDQSKTPKPAKKIKDIPPRKLTGDQAGSVKGGGVKGTKPTTDLFFH
jgi:hypothetical protein